MIDVDPWSLDGRIGTELAVSEWFTISQDDIDRFAEATRDQQWIHTDPARAAAESPYHTTIAHGFLTLSLVTALMRSAIQFPRLRMTINYGLNRVRFVSPVPAGSRVRGRFTPQSVEKVADDAVQAIWQVTIEREHGDRPCCVAEWIVRYYRGTDGTLEP